MLKNTIGWLILLVALHLNLAELNVFAYRPEWKREFYNPDPISDGNDFILPIPGGGAMTFRPVIIIQKNITDSKQFTLGNSYEGYAPVEYPRSGSISGVFEKEKGKRLFYIGKYEVTVSQYEAVMHRKHPTVLSNIPKVNVSWFEAVRFCHELTLWLMRTHIQLLPKDGQTPGYIRLPTEEEWEFACRGGEMVQPNFFYRDHFIPDEESDTDYVQYFRSGDVETLQPIGNTKKPNPLGLFDMLGNASEICFDIFRLNYHFGRSGGYIVKGGDLETPGPREIRSSFRIEVPFYNQKKADAYRSGLDGFRVIVTAPFITSLQRNDVILAAWKRDRLPAKGQLRLSFEEAMNKINHVYEHIKDPNLKRDLRSIKNSHDSIAREIYAIEMNDAVSFFRIGSYCANVVAIQAKRIKHTEYLLGTYSKDPATDPKFIQQIKENRKNFQKTIEQDLDTYGDAVESLAKKYQHSPDLVEAACDHVVEKKRLQEKEEQIPALRLLLKHVQQFSQRNAALWRRDILDSGRFN